MPSRSGRKHSGTVTVQVIASTTKRWNGFGPTHTNCSPANLPERTLTLRTAWERPQTARRRRKRECRFGRLCEGQY